jgi:hypothetical protein
MPCATFPVYVHEFGRDSLRQIIDDARGVWYSPSGHLVYVGPGGGLFAIAFDADRLETTGGALPVAEGIPPFGFTVAASGDALYLTGASALGLSELVWVGRSGAAEAIDPDWKGGFAYPTLAPDGSAVAVSLRESEGAANIWIKRLGGGRQKLTFGARNSWRPAWIDGGAAVMYVVTNEGDTSGVNGDLWRRRADGSAEPELLLDVSARIWEGELSRDGQWLAYRINDRAVDANVYARRTSGDTTTLTVLKSPAAERGVALSPDGRWMAYASDESGNYEVYIVSFPVPTSRQLVSRGGGSTPRWRADGQELFFMGGTHMMAVPVTPGTNLVLGEPTPLFPLEGFLRNVNRADYDVASDGRRFLMVRSLTTAAESDLVYVQNFATELRQKLQK